jgi:hypothetical protein
MKSQRIFSMDRYALLITCIAVLACNNDSNWSANALSPTDAQGVSTQAQATAQGGNFMRFVQHKVIDRQATGRQAISFLVPIGWTVKDSLFWVYQDPIVPIRYGALCESRDGSMKVNLYADYRTVWSRGMMTTQGERPPSNIINALKFSISRLKPGVQVRYTEQQIIPAMAMPSQQNGNIRSRSTSERGYVKFEYMQNGQAKEEVLYGKLETNQISTMGTNNPDAIAWTLDEAISCSANKGQLEMCKKIALTIRASARMTLPFYNRLVQVVQLLTDKYYADVFAAGQISKIISQTNDQILKTISDSYWSAQRSNDRVNQQFSDYVRGVDRYNDGSGLELQLPSGYNNAWSNPNTGEYFVSDQPGFDPSRELGGNWKQLQRR